jgi:hypothetical protein
MLLVFIDETSDAKFRDYLGFSIATIDSRFYPSLKQEAHAILRGVNWDPSVEFKGSHLFSQSKGCSGVEVAARVEAARQLLRLNVAAANKRIRFCYGDLRSQNQKADYLAKLPTLLYRALRPPAKGAGKNLAAVTVDARSDVSDDELQSAFAPVLQARGWVLLERIVRAKSSCDTVGLMLADIVGYLLSRVETITNDAELFEGMSPEALEQSGQMRKLRSSTELVQLLKGLKLYEHVRESRGGPTRS